MTSSESTVAVGSWKRLDGVDLLRGLAIFFVLMNHVNMRLLIIKVPYLRFVPSALVEPLVWNGQRGVQMFFVVSGFLITSITIRRWGLLPQVKVRDFYRLRFARIAPLLFLLLAILSGLHFARIHNFIVPAKTGGLGRALLAALTFHVNVLEAHRGYLPANWDILWSLSVEEMFYLFFPQVCRLLGRGRLLIGLLVTFVALGPFARTVLTHGSEVWREYSYLGGMDAIALGCLTAMLVAQTDLSRSALRTLGSVGCALLVFGLVFPQLADNWGLSRAGLDMTILALGTSMFIAATTQTQWKAPRLLVPLLKIGQYSYEVYLTHMFVIFALFALFVAEGKAMGLVPILFAVSIGLSGLLGAAVATLYSEPMNRFLRYVACGHERLASMLQSRTAVASEGATAD